MTGYTREDLVAGRLDWISITPREWLPVDVRRLEDAKINGACPTYEKEFFHKDGTRVPVLVGYALDAETRRDAVVFVVDISRRKRVETALRESEEHYRWSVELSPQLPWTADPGGRLLEIGPRWLELVGLSREDAFDHGWTRAVHPDDVGPALERWQACIAAGTPLDTEFRVQSREGGYRWFRSRSAPRRSADGTILRWYGSAEDVDDHKRADLEMREAAERFRLAIDAAGIGIWDYDCRTGRTGWSSELKTMIGLPETTVPDVALYLSIVHPDDRVAVAAVIGRTPDVTQRRRFENRYRIVRAFDGEERWLAIRGLKICDEEDRPLRVVLTIRDVTEQENAGERVRWATEHDALTGLPNRLRFDRQAGDAITRAAGSTVGLLLVDIDELKRVNDSLGQAAGDALLHAFAARLTDAVGHRGQVARLGGDDFAVIVEDTNVAELEALAAAIRTEIQRPVMYEGTTLECRSTMGAAMLPQDGSSTGELLRSAELALAAAKGTTRLALFHPRLRAALHHRSAMLATAREALHSSRVMPFYQPKVELATGRLAGFEARMRWRDGAGAVRLPGAVAAAFEDPELAVALGDRMIEKVVADLRAWLDSGLPFGHVAVNASEGDFRQDGFSHCLLDRLAAAQVPTSCFELEVTESVFLGRGADTVERVLRTLHDAGVRIALDDFGTGFASLSHLKRFPVNVLKIDRSFVRGLLDEGSDSEIVRAVIGLGRNLGIEVVAEGVERPAEADFLRTEGCAIGQGFLFGRAVEASTVPGLVAGWAVES